MRRTVSTIVLAGLLALGSIGATHGATREGVYAGEAAGPINEGEVVVKFRGGLRTASQRMAFAAAAGLQETGVMEATGWVSYHIADGTATLEKIDRLREMPDVLQALPDRLGEWTVFPATPPNDPKWSSQWGHTRINMLGAWQIAGGGAGNRMLVVMDTGVRGGIDANGNWSNQHEDLGFIDGRNFVLPYVNGQPQRKKFSDQCGHGTQVAGVAAAFTNNGKGVAGVAYNAPIWSLRINDTGCAAPSMVAAAKAINWAVDNGAYAITASFVHVATDAQVQYLKDAVDRAWANNVLVVAASGNGDASNFNAYVPARWFNVITVGGTDSIDNRCRWRSPITNEWEGANYGSPGLDVSAPCHTIWTTILDGTYGWTHGTSIAVPYVTGIVFLVKSRYPSWTSSQIKTRINNTADKVGGYGYTWDPGVCGGQSSQLGCGLLDADGAVN